MSALDSVVIVLYLVGVVALGVGVSVRARRRHPSASAQATDYFLAGRTLSWPVIGFALFATNISCVHLVSLAQSGYDTGLLNGNFEWMAAPTLIVLAVFFAPLYLRSGAATLPDFLERRYDRACRDWLTVVSIFSAIVVHIGFAFLTGGRMIALLFPHLGGIYAAIIVIAALTGLYTILGGLLSVVVTETVQTVVLIAGATAITAIAYRETGGWHTFTESLCALHATSKLSMLRPAGDPSGMPWYAVLLGYPVLGIWYWCADQTIVQRVLGARDDNQARGGALFCAAIKVLPVFIFVLPGLLAFVLAKTGRLNTSALQHVQNGAMVTDTKDIYAVMITQLLPAGVRGLVLAALLAALMSTVAGALNSISTLASYDIYRRFVPDCGDRQLVRVGRLAAGISMLLSIGLVPLLDLYGSLFAGLNDIIAHIAPPITSVFLLGVLWRGATAASARWTLWMGSALGAAVFAANKLLPGSLLARVPFMMMAFYLLVACLVFQTVMALLTRSAEPAASTALAWTSPWRAFAARGWPGVADYRIVIALLAVIYGVLYWIFA